MDVRDGLDDATPVSSQGQGADEHAHSAHSRYVVGDRRGSNPAILAPSTLARVARAPSTRGRYHQDMIDIGGAASIARAWVAERIDLAPTDWPSGTYGNFGPPEDYFVFPILPRPLRHVGASHYIAPSTNRPAKFTTSATTASDQDGMMEHRAVLALLDVSVGTLAGGLRKH